MPISIYIIIIISLYSLVCVMYVSHLRRQARYRSLSQYVRKSWLLFSPLTCLLCMTAQASMHTPISNANSVDRLSLRSDNTQMIREEELTLQNIGAFDVIKTSSSIELHEILLRTLYKRGWCDFFLTWHNTTHNTVKRRCPKNFVMLEHVHRAQGALFSILPLESVHSLHSDPTAESFQFNPSLNNTDAKSFFNGTEVLTPLSKESRDV